MEEITPPAQRRALAEQHRQAMARSGRSQRQTARLRLLHAWGKRYGGPEAANPPRRILIIRPDHLGDLLFATPALHLLRASFPQAHIAGLVGPWGEAVLAGNQDLDELLTCPFPGFTRQPKANPLAPYRLLQTEARRLAALRFDLALVLRFDHWWGAWLAAAAGIPQRLGYAIAEVQPFLTRAIPYVVGRHEVVQNLALALAAGGSGPLAAPGDQPSVTGEWLSLVSERLSAGSPPGRRRGDDDFGSQWRLHFAPSAEDEAAAAALLPATARPLVAIHPGSGAAVKRWRTAAWAELARRLATEMGAQVLFTGAAGETELIDPVLALLAQGPPLPLPPLSLAGQTSLGALAALYRRCALAIGPDSGPLHLAVAMGTPTVHLYGPVERRTFGPWGSARRHVALTSDWGCIPCNRLDWPAGALVEHGCVRDIAVEQVLAEAVKLLG
ncbi:MAG TPA: glycosyltransferase family 9 protein [Anaerolineae bacterium]|nr:glycosyltransferase family 9 protein [Anaerolineae bacterium]HNU02558.1 glycosyltransferase family 9 protein [Anaerolineae bacterium]